MNHTHFKNASELLREFTTFSMRDPQNAAEIFAEEGAFEMSYLADFGFPPRYAGRAEIGSFFKMVRELYPGFEFENIVIHMATPEQVFAEYEFTAESSVTKQNIRRMPGCEGREDQVVAGGAQRSSIGTSDLFTRNTPIARHDLTRRHL